MKKASDEGIQFKLSKLEKEIEEISDKLSQKEKELQSTKKELPENYKSTLEAYRKEKEFVQSLVDTAQVIILVLDTQASIVSINPFMENLSGYSQKEVVGKDWFRTFLPDRDKEKIRKVFLEVIDNTEVLKNVNPIIIKNGEEREIEWNNKTLKDTDGKVIGLLSIGTDVTERLMMERQNSHLKEVLLAIRNINQLITHEKDLDVLIQKVCDSLTKTRSFNYAWIVIMDDNKLIINSAESGMSDDFHVILDQYEKGNNPICIQRAFNDSTMCVINNSSKECSLCPCIKMYTGNAGMAIRLEHDGVFYGVMSVSLPKDFVVNKEEENLFKEVASDVALAINNIKLDEKKAKAELALKNSELKYRTIFNSSHDGIFIFDRLGNLVEINKKGCDLYGRTKEDMLKISPQEFMHPETLNTFKECQQSVLAGEDFNAEVKGFHIDGSIFEAEVYGTGVEINEELYLFSALRNITKEKQAKIALQKSEERFRLLAENASDVIYRMSLPSGKYEYISPSCEKIFGRTQEEFYKSPALIKEILHPNWRDYFKLQWERLLRGEMPSYYEYQVIHKSGEVKWISQQNSLIKDEEENIIAIEGIVHDVTERKLVEVALRRSENKYRNFIDNTVLGVFTSTLAGEITFANKAIIRMLEYDNEKDLFKDDGISKYKNPQDRTKFVELLLQKRSVTNYEIEVLTKKGNSLFINMNAVLEGNDFSGMVIDVTERVKAQNQLIHLNRKLHENVKEYTNLFNSTGTATCIYNDDKIITLCNAKFEELSGYPRKEVEGKMSWNQFVKKKDLEKMKGYHMQRSNQEGNPPAEYDFELVDRKGKSKQVHLQIGLNRFTKDRIASLIDITGRKRMEQALLESETKFRTYIESSPTSIFIFDKKRRFLFVNKSACKLLKYSTKEFFELSIDDIISEEDRQKNEKDLSGMLQFESLKTEIVFETKNKKKVHAIFEAVRLSNNELIAYCTDISKLKSIEKALIRAKNKAVESDKLKSAFLANMSHEIRTPMNGILGFAQLLKKKTIPDELKQNYVDVINIKGNQLLQLITDIVDISKIEANQISIDKRVFCLNKLMQDLDHFYKTLIKKERKKVELELKVSYPDEESIIISDHVRVEQILTNLLSNAMKFTIEGKIEFGYTIRDDGFMEFYVKDTGVGLTRSDQKIIFNRFVQAAKTAMDLKGGTGLGLAISKGFVELLGGNIWVESQLNKGSVFYFTIPYEFGNSLKVDNDEIELVEYDWRGKVILVVEDEEINFQLIEAIIEPTNATIYRASTGKEAIAQNKKIKNIDVILMDIKMPIMNGLDATKVIRKSHKELPIIAQTAYAMSTDAAECISAGCDEYISKPIDPAVLLNTLNKYLLD